jgi:hypothetical protein
MFCDIIDDFKRCLILLFSRFGGAPCNCGKSGCIETIASATGIVRIAKEKLAAVSDLPEYCKYDRFLRRPRFYRERFLR